MSEESKLPEPLILVSPEFLSGEPVFNGTRVPVRALFDYLEAGDPLEDFLSQFPDVSRSHAIAVIKLARNSALSQAGKSARLIPKLLSTLQTISPGDVREI